MSLSILAPQTWTTYDGGPFGTGVVLCQEDRIIRISLPGKGHAMQDGLMNSVKRHFASEDREGFAGECAARLSALLLEGKDVADLPFSFPENATGFTRRVLELCFAIPLGQTRTYGELAAAAGSPGASRAVGNVMATNQLPLLIPCHRVVASNGRIGNYGGGTEMKRWLLEREGAL